MLREDESSLLYQAIMPKRKRRTVRLKNCRRVFEISEKTMELSTGLRHKFLLIVGYGAQFRRTIVKRFWLPGGSTLVHYHESAIPSTKPIRLFIVVCGVFHPECLINNKLVAIVARSWFVYPAAPRARFRFMEIVAGEVPPVKIARE